MSIDSGSSRAAVKIGSAIWRIRVSVSASRISDTAQAGAARQTMATANRARSQAIKIPRLRLIYRVHSLT
jgi:hypothetical protein